MTNKCRPVDGFEERYLVYENGTIVTTKRTLYSHGKYIETTKHRKLRPSIDKKGYLVVNLYNNQGKSTYKKVHRLVAGAFIPNPFNKRCVCHKDNNKLNCCVDNLYWGTDKENQDQAWADGLHNNIMPIQSIDENGHVTQYASQSEASRKTGIPQANIWKCINGKRKTAGGMKWQKSG